MSRAAWLIVATLLIGYAAMGHRYAQVWRSDRTLWPYAASVTPLNPIPVVNAAMVKRR